MSNYISGTYGLKYVAEWQNFRKQIFRIEVHEKGFTGTSKTMGHFQNALLEIQGDEGNPTSPIVKTQLRFMLVDSWDEADTSTTKYGGWEEFYTPDSTRFLVILKSWRDNAWVTRWSGYITPDSWSENLEYRGSITITARDNIGHLQDFPFDLAGDGWGLVSLRSVITAAMQKINLPMDFQEANQNLPSIDGDGTNLLDSSVCIKTFEKDNWKSVLEDVLDSIGYTIRWTDFNRITLAPIRHLPLMGEDDYQHQEQQSPLEFYGGSRTLDPAYKQIIDTLDYDGDNSVDLDVMHGLNFGEWDGQLYTMHVEGNVFDQDGASLLNSGTSDGYGWQSGRGFINGEASGVTQPLLDEEGEDALRDAAILAMNQATPSFMQVYKARVLSPAATLRIDFAGLVRQTSGYGTGYSVNIAPLHRPLASMRVYISYEVGQNQRYWDGNAWVENVTYIDREVSGEAGSGYSVEFALGVCDLGDGGNLYIGFDSLTCKKIGESDKPCYGIYARIVGISLTANSARLESDKVTTTNNSDYNVTMDRNPAVGALSRAVPIVSPANYPNALFHVKNGVLQAFPYGVSWGQGQAVKPLPVLIHQQILMFHHTTLSILSGDCAPSGNNMPYFDAVWTYKNRNLILQSGTWDMGTGIVNGANLRGYIDYDDLWDDTGADYSGSSEYDTDAYKDRPVSQPASSGGGGGGGGTGTVTSVGISMPTGFSVSGSPVTTSGTFQVAFASGYSLPKTTDVSKGVAAYGAMTDMATDIQQNKDDIADLDDRVTAIEQGGGGGGSVVSWGTQSTTSNTINLTVNGTTKALVQQAGYDNLDDRVTALEGASPGTGGVSSIRVRNSSGTDGTYTPVNGVVTLPNYPTMLRNPNSLILSKTVNGTVIKEYNGEQGVTFTAADLEAALDGVFATLSALEDYVDADTLENMLLGYVSTGTDVQTVQGFKKFIGGIGFASAATASSGLRLKVVNSTINGVTKSRIHIYGDVVVHGELASGDSSNNND